MRFCECSSSHPISIIPYRIIRLILHPNYLSLIDIGVEECVQFFPSQLFSRMKSIRLYIPK